MLKLFIENFLLFLKKTFKFSIAVITEYFGLNPIFINLVESSL